MLAADGDLYRLLGTHADLFQIGERRAGHDEFQAFRIARLHGLAAERHAVAVHGHHGHYVVFHLDERAGIHRARFVRGDGEARFGDHARHGILRQGKIAAVIQRGKLRKIVRRRTGDGVIGVAAGDVHRVVSVRADGNDAVRQLAHDVAEELGVDHNAARCGNVRFKRRINALFEIVARNADIVSGLDEQTFHRRDRAFGGGGAARGGDGETEQIFFAGKFHGNSSVSFRKKDRLFFRSEYQ